jgi:serine/threonine protein kinase
MDEPEKTSLYGDQKNNKTGIYINDENKTGIYSNNEIEIKPVNQGISLGDKIKLKEKQYFVRQIISKGTGEANVYQIEDINGNLLALKLYFEFKDEAEEPNGIALERIQKLDDPDILKLIDFGIGSDKFNGKYCYEISDFAQGGNILDVADFKEKYTPEFILESIVPQTYLAITKLHEFKIYHCDLKPGNILYKDKEQTDILIGDYGSAKAYDLKSEKALRKSTTIKGTEFYLAPEQARGIVSEKNDYYSFGMILLHLLYPESFSKGPDFRNIDKDKFEQIVERQYNLKPIIDFDPKLKKLNNLIEGLTLINHINRWGSKEFEKWLNGEKVEVTYYTKGGSDVKPLKTGPIDISTPEEFVSYIENKSTWFQDFFEDQDVYKLIKDWLDSLIGIPERKRFEKVVDIYKLSGKNILKSAISLFLLPQMPITVEGQSFEFKESILKDVTDYLAKIDSIYKIATIDQLSLYFFQLEFKLNLIYYLDTSNKTLETIIYKLYNPILPKFNMAESFNFKMLIPGHIKPPKGDFNYEYLISIFYAFNQDRSFPDNAGKPLNNLEELTIFYLKYDKLYRDKYHTYERNALLQKLKSPNLIGVELKELAGKALSKNTETYFKLEHISFEKLCNVHYSINEGIGNYLNQQGIDWEMTVKEEKGFMYVAKNKLFAGIAANDFIKYLKKEHSDKLLSAESLSLLKKQFIKEHRQSLLLNRIVSVATSLFILVVVVAIILRVLNIINK